MEILVNVIGQKLKIATNLKCFISGSQQFVKFIFNMDDSWDNLTTFAQFRQNDVAYNQYLDANNSVYLPREIGAGACTLILYGTGGNVRATTNYLTLTIDENILVTNAQSTEITQSLYEQLVNAVTTSTNRLQDRVSNVENVIQGLAGGAPIVVSSVSEMTDTEQIYVLSTDGNWYYHNGSAWTAGGEYGAVATDTTLTQSGMPADAKAVGDAIDGLENAISSVSLSTEVKQALLALLEKVAYVVEDGQDLYDALDLALNPPPGLRSITAAYTQSASVYKNSSLDDLRIDLVVTAHYFDGTTQVVTAYTLSGTLKVGTSTVTVTYAGKTATFTTTVSVRPLPAAYQRVTYVQSNGDSAVNLRRTINRGLNADNSITKYLFEVDAELLDTQPNCSTNMLIATANDCWLGYNTSANAIGVGTSSGMTFSGSKTDRHTYTMQITTDGNIVAERDDGARVTRAYTVASGTASTGLLGLVRSGGSDYRCAAKIYSYKMYYDGELVRDLVPCYRKSDDVVGLYDMVNDNYFYTLISGAFTKGADVT